MAVVTLKYIRSKEAIKAHLRYITHRRGEDQKKITRDLFNKWGLTEKDASYRLFDSAGRGTVFFKFMISPDPGQEDTLKDLDLQQLTRRTIAKLQKAINRRLPFVAAIHDHTGIRHVHGVFLLRGRLSKTAFRKLQESVHAGATRDARLQRKARDLFIQNPRNRVLHARLGLARARGGKMPQTQPGCRSCGYGQFSGLPSFKAHCPMCRAPLRETRQPRLHLREERRQ